MARRMSCFRQGLRCKLRLGSCRRTSLTCQLRGRVGYQHRRQVKIGNEARTETWRVAIRGWLKTRNGQLGTTVATVTILETRHGVAVSQTCRLALRN
jgi:hypothetical protein